MSRHQPRRSVTGQKQQLRIIGGRWRGRKLHFADAPDLRPSGDRIRETLFNWLAPHLPGARCLDLFAGSGALGYEALSRGARQAVMLEKHPQAISSLRAAAQQLDAGDAVQIIATDTIRWLARPAEQVFNIVFLDPPFTTELYPQVITLLLQHGWLAEEALLYIESDHPPGQWLTIDNWHQLREKRAGVVYHGLYGRTASAPESTNEN